MLNKESKIPFIGKLSLVLAAGALSVGCANTSSQTKKAELKPAMEKTMVKQEVKQPEVKMEQKEQTAVEATAAIEISENEKFPIIEVAQIAKPEQSVFYFGFDKTEINEDDLNMINDHVEYLLENPELVLTISGHTDHHGPRVYNEYLSKTRAENIAKIFIEAGVPESQLVISAKADDQPLENVESTKKNRRVELEYKELNVVSTH